MLLDEMVKYCEEVLPLIDEVSSFGQEKYNNSEFSFFGHSVNGKVVGRLISDKHFRHLIKEIMLWHEISIETEAEIDEEDNIWKEKMIKMSDEINDYLDSALSYPRYS